jgi:hypothetical protein
MVLFARVPPLAYDAKHTTFSRLLYTKSLRA